MAKCEFVLSDGKLVSIHSLIPPHGVYDQYIHEAALLFSEYIIDGNVFTPISRCSSEEISACITQLRVLGAERVEFKTEGVGDVLITEITLPQGDMSYVVCTEGAANITGPRNLVEDTMWVLIKGLLTDISDPAKTAARYTLLYAIHKVFNYDKIYLSDKLRGSFGRNVRSDLEGLPAVPAEFELPKLQVNGMEVVFPELLTMQLCVDVMLAEVQEYM